MMMMMTWWIVSWTDQRPHTHRPHAVDKIEADDGVLCGITGRYDDGDAEPVSHR